MKVVHVGEYVQGGVATYVREVLCYQKECEEISDLYLIKSNINSENEFPIDVMNVYNYEYERSVRHFFKAIRTINRIIKHINPDIIHVHSSFAGLFVRVPYLFFSKKNLKIIYCSHGWSFNMNTSLVKKKVYGLVERLLLKVTDKIINISGYENNTAIQYKIKSNKMITIENGIREANYSKYFKAVEVDKNKINLLFVGRNDYAKGLDSLINLLDNYELNHVVLYIIGDYTLTDNIKNSRAASQVKPLGWVNNDLIDNYYQLCDAVIVPSRWEAFGLVAIEAMRNTKAVIATNKGNLPNIVLDNKTGYIYDGSDEQLLNILSSLEKCELEKMGKNGYGYYYRKYRNTTMNEQLLDCYKSL
ncbi:glycosyltransferase [Priestia megaterium]